MASYESFARVYDLFMDNIPYEKWCQNIRNLLERYEIREGLVLELGCGTGSMTERLAQAGYDMIGVDNSLEMLEAAIEKRDASGSDILYLLQDMREFELYGTVRAVVSVCDSLNYITDPRDLLAVFRLVNNYLDPGGVFLFDLNTPYKYETLLGDSVIAENREEGSFIWENWYDSETKINEYDLTLFIKEKGELYRRFQETHYQRAYSPAEVRRAAAEAGMEFEACWDAFSRDPVKPDSERMYMVFREKGKTERNG